MPDRSVLFSGDLLFRGGTPFLLMGSVDGAIGVLEELKQLPAVTIVPGHGGSAGLSPLEAARELDLGPYGDLIDAERIVGNLHRAYAELDGAPPGAPIDTVAALTDMVSYTSGQPLTCYA